MYSLQMSSRCRSSIRLSGILNAFYSIVLRICVLPALERGENECLFDCEDRLLVGDYLQQHDREVPKPIRVRNLFLAKMEISLNFAVTHSDPHAFVDAAVYVEEMGFRTV